MSLTKTTAGVTNISDLSSTPNATEGLTAAQLQAKFDKTGADLKTYINDTLTVEQDAINGKLDSITKFITSTAVSAGDYKINITNELLSGLVVYIYFPAAATNTQNARLSIDNGSTYKNIKFFDGTQTLASEIETTFQRMYYNGTDFILLVESFSRTTTNGVYTKYKNGTMIWVGSKTESSIVINVAVGSIYRCSGATYGLANFDVTFAAAPAVSATIETNSPSWLLQRNPYTSTTNTGYVLIGAGTSSTASDVKVVYHAIGRWK